MTHLRVEYRRLFSARLHTLVVQLLQIEQGESVDMEYKIYKLGDYPIWPSNDYICRGRYSSNDVETNDTENNARKARNRKSIISKELHV